MKQSRQPKEHAEKESGVHQTDADIVSHQVKVRNAVFGVSDADRTIDDRCPLPKESHQNFQVEVHSFADVFPLEKRSNG